MKISLILFPSSDINEKTFGSRLVIRYFPGYFFIAYNEIEIISHVDFMDVKRSVKRTRLLSW